MIGAYYFQHDGQAQAMPAGHVVAILFFALLAIAALTSTVSLLEVVVSYVVDEHRWSRKKSVWTVATITVSMPS